MKKGKFVELETDRRAFGIEWKWFESLEWRIDWDMSKKIVIC